MIMLRRENKKRDAGARDEIIEGMDSTTANVKNGKFKSVDEARAEKGDEWSGFRYTL